MFIKFTHEEILGIVNRRFTTKPIHWSTFYRICNLKPKSQKSLMTTHLEISCLIQRDDSLQHSDIVVEFRRVDHVNRDQQER